MEEVEPGPPSQDPVSCLPVAKAFPLWVDGKSSAGSLLRQHEASALWTSAVVWKPGEVMEAGKWERSGQDHRCI